ncbi:MAG: phosphonate ABC transporter, permease protein PhnE [Solirubrobacteraceae bacterium MAG38_C4-C5]|nr:phosphonate ABC transporter, permease protein PhnE [Candidatus Siliceabacter maunaloa]
MTLRSRRALPGALALAALVAVHVAAWIATEFSLPALAGGYEGMVGFMAEAIPPELNWSEVVLPGIQASLVTLATAIMGTTLSIPFALGLAVLAAHNATPKVAVYQAARSTLSFLRAVPDIVFALIFVTAVGLGPFPGVLAILFHNVGVMGKLWAESIEESDPGPVDALRTSGARRSQLVANAVLPAVTPQWVGLGLYRFEVNVRSSLVLGLVGAGGIGFLINGSIKLFRFDELFTYILIVLLMVIAVDQLSAAIRKRIT